MKKLRLVLFVATSLLFSCAAIKPGIPMKELPAGPLLQVLEQRARLFSTLKSGASLQVVRKDHRRVFENAGVLVRGRDRFRIEAYGPLGQTVFALVWTGQDLLLDFEGTRRILPPQGAGLERFLGSEVDPGDLADILAGNLPGMSRAIATALRCPVDGGACELDLRWKDRELRAHPDPDGEPQGGIIRSCEVLRKGSLVYQVRYESFENISGYLLPKKITLENPDKQVVLTVQYFEPEVNVPVDEEEFALPGGRG